MAALLGQRDRGPDRAAPQPVERGVHDDPVQPGRDRGVAAELVGAAVGGDEGVLQGVRGLLRVTGRPQGHGPQPVAVALDEERERPVVAGDVPGEEFGVGALVLHGQGA